MKRQIFIVDAHIVDSNGTFHIYDGFPVTYDSRSYVSDGTDGIKKAETRAKGKAYETFGAMCKVDNRQIQTVTVTTIDGFQVVKLTIGELPDETIVNE